MAKEVEFFMNEWLTTESLLEQFSGVSQLPFNTPKKNEYALFMFSTSNFAGFFYFCIF